MGWGCTDGEDGESFQSLDKIGVKKPYETISSVVVRNVMRHWLLPVVRSAIQGWSDWLLAWTSDKA